VTIQRNVVANVLRLRTPPKRAPLIMRIINAVPLLQRIPARIVAIGFLPEHVAPIQAGVSARK
jgi:hypothetical protein